jgi:hypothetical protein
MTLQDALFSLIRLLDTRDGVEKQDLILVTVFVLGDSFPKY